MKSITTLYFSPWLYCLSISASLSDCQWFLPPPASINSNLVDVETLSQSVCDGQIPIANYVPPSCDHSRCGSCFKVTNQGGIGGDASGVGQSIIVQIIDACPATNAWNFCKTEQPDTRQKCMDPGTNSLDIEQNAYTALTGQAYASVSASVLAMPLNELY